MVLLALFFGGLGIHDFILGRTAAGVGKLVLLVFGWIPVFIGTAVLGIWCIVDAIAIAADKTPGAWE